MFKEHLVYSRPYSGCGDSAINKIGKILALMEPEHGGANLEYHLYFIKKKNNNGIPMLKLL